MSGEQGTAAPAAAVGTEATGTEATGITNPQVGATPNQTEKMIDKISRKFKVKLDGQEQEVDEQELIDNYQLRKVSNQRLEEGVKARKQAESLIEMLRTDPKRVLTDPRIGLDIKKFAEDIIYQQLQDEMMDPRDRELQEYKKKVQDYEAKLKNEDQERIQKEQQSLHNQRKDAYVTDIRESLSSAGLPINDYTVGKVVSEMTKAIKSGFTEVSAQDVMELVHSNFIKDTKSLYGNSSEETLMKLLGDDVAKKIRNYDVEKYKKANSIPKTNNFKGNGSVPQNKPTSSAAPKTPEQIRQEIEKRFGINS